MVEQSGEGEFKGSGEFVNRVVEILGRLEVRQTSIDAKLSSVEAGLSSVEAGLSSVEAGQKSLRTDFLGELSKTRIDIMGKVTELRGDVKQIRDDVDVNMAPSTWRGRSTTTHGLEADARANDHYVETTKASAD